MRVGQSRIVNVATEYLARHRFAMTDLFSDHDVGLMLSARSRSRTSASSPIQSSLSTKYTYLPWAAYRPRFLGRRGQPELGMRIRVMLACCAEACISGSSGSTAAEHASPSAENAAEPCAAVAGRG